MVKRKDYRIKLYDPLLDIYILQKRFLWIFWRSVSVGKKKEIENYLEELYKTVTPKYGYWL